MAYNGINWGERGQLWTDGNGHPVRRFFHGELTDDATAETKYFELWMEAEHFANFPANGTAAQRRQFLQEWLRPRLRHIYQAWVAERAAPQPPPAIRSKAQTATEVGAISALS